MRYKHLIVAVGVMLVWLAMASSVLAIVYLVHTVDYPGQNIQGHWLTGVNNVGQIVGDYQDQNSIAHGFVYSAGTFSAPLTPAAAVFAINDSGQIAGETSDSTGLHGVIFNGGTPSPPVDFPNSVSTEILGINNAGDIVGDYQLAGSSAPLAFRRSTGTFAGPLNVPGAARSLATGINNAGTVVGTFYDALGITHGFVMSGTMGTQFDVPSSTRTELWGINSADQIVGCYEDAVLPGKSYPFVHLSGFIHTFHIPMAASGCALKINDAGQIVGYYYDAGGMSHGFVATPVPDRSQGVIAWCQAHPLLCHGLVHPWDIKKPGDPTPRFLPVRPVQGVERMDCEKQKGLCQEMMAAARETMNRPTVSTAVLLTTIPVHEKPSLSRPSK